LSNRRCSALTLTELLVLLALTAILSAMLFPVFAASRERARQAVCLANIKSICRAFRMYLSDNDDKFPPRELRVDARTYFNSRPGGGDDDMWNPDRVDASAYCHRVRLANPYVRRPVVLDPYLASREVWRCPDARLEGGASFINAAQDWLIHLRAHQGEWGMNSDPYLCPGQGSFPAGWGGEVTDSLTQRRLAVPTTGKGRVASPGMFLQSIGVTEAVASYPVPGEFAIEDPAWFVICADGGATIHDFCAGSLAYPDLCHLECAGASDWPPKWDECPWSRECLASPEMTTNPALRRLYARHFGGVNIGLLDGHARWFDSEQVIAEAPSHGNPHRGRLRGFEPRGPTWDADWYDPAEGITPLY
jgi:prepilin-type processing-associated H-X9-DG protein